ncbi:MAG: hypothetical protein JXQ27_17345 [Acidobacteria bacterium]|nr:hypothetical protein [Acidobacteriota bacterium]
MNGRPISDWQLERYLLDELPPAERQRTAGALAGDVALQARLERLRQSDGEILERYPPAVIAEKIAARASRRGGAATGRNPAARLFTPRRLAGAAVLLLLGVSLWLLRSQLPFYSAVPEEGIRSKGPGLSLTVFRQTADGVEVLPDGSRVKTGDVLQLACQVAEPVHAAILSLDGRGVITRHWPETGENAARLEGDDPQVLEFAYRLDDAPHGEIFILVVADQPFPLAVIEAAIRRQPVDWTAARPLRLDLPAEYRHRCLALFKE